MKNVREEQKGGVDGREHRCPEVDPEVNTGGIKDEVPVGTSGSMFSRRAESLSMAARSLG